MTRSLQHVDEMTAADDDNDVDDDDNDDEEDDDSCIPNKDAPYCSKDETALASSSRYPNPIIFPNPDAPNIPCKEGALFRDDCGDVGCDCGDVGCDERKAMASIARHTPTWRTYRVRTDTLD